jgi:hypothetical protein
MGRLLGRVRPSSSAQPRRRGEAGPWLLLHGGMLLGGAYGAYFGAGLGVMLLGLLGLLGVFVHDAEER